MSSAPFSTGLVIEHLRATVADLQQVEGAAQYAAITRLGEFRADSAYVLLVKERSDDEPPKAGRQRALVTFGVVIAVTNYRDRAGGESIEDISPLIGHVRAALMGWQPPISGGRPCQWLQGEVLDYDASILLWAETYRTQHFIGGTP